MDGVYRKAEKTLLGWPGQTPGTEARQVAPAICLQAAWLLVVVTVALHHELWRDEVRALSIAISVNSPLELLGALADEGHPALWHLILYLSHGLLGSHFVLQSVSLCIAFVLVSLLLFRGPFPLWFKAMFVFGIFPIYEYSVMARNYGISMLLFFIFAWAYTAPVRRRWLLGLLIALLANTNVHSLLLTAILLLVWLGEEFLSAREESVAILLRQCSAGIVVALGGIAIAVLTIWPHESTIPTPVRISLHEVASASLLNGLLPARKFSGIMPFPYELNLLNSMLIWVLVAGLIRRPVLSIALLAGFAIIGVFSDVVYMLAVRHQGVAYGFAICLYWIALNRGQEPARGTLSRLRLIPLNLPAMLAIAVVFPSIMGCHIYKGFTAATGDVREEKSSTASFARWLNSRSELREAIVISEPDFAMEALPYYADNPLYLIRERRFAKVFRSTTASHSALGLGELLATARILRRDLHKPVLIALGTDLIDLDAHEQNEVRSGTRTFTWSAAERDEFRSATRLLAVFDSAVTNENYRVYLLDQ